MTKEQLDREVARIGAYLLGITPEEVTSDTRRWAAFHWDDGFVDDWFTELDWEKLEVPAESWNASREDDQWFWARNDFDLAGTIIDWEGFLPDETTDKSLRELFVDGSVYGSQFATLLSQGRASVDRMELPMVIGRVKAQGETLIDALRALLMLDEFPEQAMDLHEFAETDEEHQAFVATFEDDRLRDHVSMFFQEPQAARCGGAAPEGIDEDDIHLRMFGKEAFKRHLAWWMGEGQGHCHLVEILDDTVPEVPEFQGRTVRLKTRKELGPLGEPAREGDSAEILATPFADYLAQSELPSAESLAQELSGRSIEAVFAGLSLVEGALLGVLDVATLRRWGEHRLVLSLLATRRPYLTEEERCEQLFLESEVLEDLGCPDEALAAALELVERVREGASSNLELGSVLGRASRSAYRAGKYDVAVDHGRQSVEVSPDSVDAKASLGVALIAAGQEDAGFELLGGTMARGDDPEPRPELERHPRYLELATEHGIPVYGAALE